MDLNIGKVLDGRYEITELIGVGGMADVYKATDKEDNKEVAVKILKDEYSKDENFVRRFRNESKAIAVLSHPNIVKIYDVGFTDEIQFIVMEYIDGVTLKDLMEQQKVMKWKVALNFIESILKALQHAHDKGIVHRDIKPQNIMLYQDGTIKVMDFGIARFSRVDGKTLSDKTVGSVHYISPEQARGDMTDERSDIYSVGVMLYEMLTGTKPFDGDNPVAIAVKHMRENALPPREIVSEIPEGLEEIIMHAMERSSSKRYQSAAEMLTDISAFKVDPSIVFGYENEEDDNSSTKCFVPVSDEDYDDEYENEEDDNEENEEDEEQESKRSYFMPILLSVTLAVILIALVMIVYPVWNKFNNDATHTGTVYIPDFVGQNVVKVQQEYSDKLKFDIKEEWSTEYEEGIIMEQSESDKTKREGFLLTLTVSKGPKRIAVPDVTGKSASEAIDLLENAGFDTKKEEVYSDEVEKGIVISTSPGAGEDAPEQSLITITVSKGEQVTQVKVPDVTKKSKREAIELIEKNKLKYEIEDVYQEEDKDMVLSQYPNKDEVVNKDTVVKLRVSTGELKSTDVEIGIKIPGTAWGAYSVEIRRNGNKEDTKTISNAEDVAGKEFKITVNGKKKETYVIYIKNSETGEQVKYATYEVNFKDKKVTTVGSEDVDGFNKITPRKPEPVTTPQTTESPVPNTDNTIPSPDVMQ